MGFCIIRSQADVRTAKGPESIVGYPATLHAVGSGCHGRHLERVACSALVHTRYENDPAGALQQEPRTHGGGGWAWVWPVLNQPTGRHTAEPLCSSSSLIKACQDPGCGWRGVSVALGQAKISSSSLGSSQFSKARTELQSNR